MKYAKTLIFLLLPVIAFAETTRETRHLELAAKGIDRLVVTCGAGTLDIKGTGGLDSVKVTAVVEVENGEPSQSLGNNLRLTLEKQKNTALLLSDIKPAFLKKRETRIHLTVDVPERMHVTIIDGSGPIGIRNIQGDVAIDDDSGSIDVENIVGRVKIADSSGSIDIDNVTGYVDVKDGSGFTELTDIDGDVSVLDGSGDILIMHVSGTVNVSDGSGDIDISDVAGDVKILSAGSGELNVERIHGKISTPDEIIEED